MRPRKRIALFCDDTTERSALTFTLDTLGFRVVQGNNLAGFAAAVNGCSPDCFLVVHDSRRPAGAGLIGRFICAKYPTLPVVAVVPEGYRVSNYITTCQVEQGADMGLMLEAVRIACARKRGPRKQHAELAVAR